MKSNMLQKGAALLLTVTLLVSFAGDAAAFNQVHARQLSMGGAAATTFRGVETIGWNPAFMAFRDNPSFSLIVNGINPNVGLRLSNDFISLDEVNTYFSADKFLTEQDKNDLLGAMTGDSWDFYIDAYVPVIEMSFQTKFAMIGLSYDVAMSSDWRFSKEFIEMAFKGNGLDYAGVERDFSDTDMRANASSRIGFTFARGFDRAFEDIEWIDEITFGFTASYLIGHGYGDIEDGSMTMYYDVGEFQSHGMLSTVNAGVYAYGDSSDYKWNDGDGIGLDLGVGAKILDGKGTIGISLINILGTIRYEHSQHRYYSFDTSEPLPLNGSLTNPQSFIDDNFDMIDSLSSEEDGVDVELPRVIHLNGSYLVGNDLLVAGNLRTTLNDAPGGKPSVRLGAGLEYSGIPILPLRFGASLGGRGGFSYGVGFGLHFGPWRTDIGWAWERGILNSASGLHMAINSVFFFGRNEELASPRVMMRRRTD